MQYDDMNLDALHIHRSISHDFRGDEAVDDAGLEKRYQHHQESMIVCGNSCPNAYIGLCRWESLFLAKLEIFY